MSMLDKIAWCKSGVCADCKIVPVPEKNFNDVVICDKHRPDFEYKQPDPEDCDHDFDSEEGFHCLNCGEDGSEWVSMAAYDRYKASRYDD